MRAMNHPDPASRFSTFRFPISTLTLVVAATATPRALGAVSDFDPGSGDSVVIDTTAPNPDTGQIIADEGPITLDVRPGAILNSGTSTGVLLDFGSVVDLDGTITATNVGLDGRNATTDSFFTISGTLSVSNPTGEALYFGTGDDTLVLEPGYSITGNVIDTGGFDTIVLGGDSGSATFNLNNIGAAAQYRSFGALRKDGDSTWTVVGANSLDFAVTQGTLTNNGSINGTTNLTGGNLRGTGSYNDLFVRGGNFSPGAGNDIATVTANSLSVLDDGVFRADIDGDGSRDVVNVTGSVLFNAGTTIQVNVVDDGNLIDDGDEWAVLSAASITDNGATITDNFAGFNFTRELRSSATGLVLIANQADLEDNALSPTGRTVGRTLDNETLPATDLDGFINRVGNLSITNAERALVASTPRNVAATRATQIRTTQRFQTGLSDYLHGKRLGLPQLSQRTAPGRTVGSTQLASAAATDPYTLAAYFAQADTDPNDPDRVATPTAAPSLDGRSDDSPWGGFGAVYAVFDQIDASEDTLGTDAFTYAGQIGLDYRIDDAWLAGVSFSYANSDIDFDNRLGDSNGSTESDTFRVGPYASFADGPWALDASLTYALHDNDLTRDNLATGDRFAADYDGQDIAAYLGLGYTVDLDDKLEGWKLTPRVSAQYVYTWTDAYTESGGGGALSVEDSEFDSLRGTFGVRLAKLCRVGDLRVMPRAEVGYAHEFLDTTDDLNARFVGGGNGFTLAAAGRDEDSIYYTAGLTALINDDTSLDLSYFGETSDDQQTDAVRLALRFDF